MRGVVTDKLLREVHEVKLFGGQDPLSKPTAFVVQLVRDFWKGCQLSDCAVSRTREPWVADFLIGNGACDTKGRRMQPCDSKDPVCSRSDGRFGIFWSLCFGVLLSVDTG
jgi:hypothetical protein